MPTQTVDDPLNYTAIYTPGSALWHDGTGLLSVTYLLEIPTIYAGTTEYSVFGTSFAPGTDPSLPLSMRNDVAYAITRFGEVALLNFSEIAQPATTASFGTPVTGDGTLVSGLGGSAGFGELTVPRADDAYFVYDISAVFSGGLNVFGTTFSQIFVNTNGSISFGNGLLSYTPFGLQNAYAPTIAPFWADVDTRSGATAGLESGEIHIDLDTVNGILSITWDNVNFYDRNGTRQNSFQLQIYDRFNGDFDVVFRYEDIDWTSGDASGGTNGLGGWAAVAGISAGNGSAPLLLPASGDETAMRGLEAGLGNTDVTGLWLFQSRGGFMDFAPSASPGGPPIGDITIGGLDFGAGAKAIYERKLGSGPFEGDIWINTGHSAMGDLSPGTRGYQIFLESLGFVSGMNRTGSSTVLSAQLDTQQYTVMSNQIAASQQSLPAAQREAPSTPQLFDIQALQIMYGPNMATRPGNNVYLLPGGNSPFKIGKNGALVATIWDAGGTDTLNASNQTTKVSLDLRPGKFSSVGRLDDNISIALGVPGTTAQSAIIENATGGSGHDWLSGNNVNNVLRGGGGKDLLLGQSGNDQLFGQSGADTLRGGSGNDKLFGGAGSDRLVGEAGVDQLKGGAGADIFVFDSRPGTSSVLDYRDEVDRLNVKALDVRFDELSFTDTGAGRVRVEAFGKGFTLIDPFKKLDATDLDPGDFIGLL